MMPGGKRPTRLFLRGAALLQLVGAAGSLGAQSVAKLRINADAVAASAANACVLSTDVLPVQQTTGTSVSPAPEDYIVLEVYSDAALTKPDSLRVPLDVRLDHSAVGTLARNTSRDTIRVGVAGLAERVVTLWPPNSTVPVCLHEPFPHRPSFAQPKAFTTHTDVIASGEVSNALRTGSENNATTGSLGFHHFSFPGVGEPVRWFPLSFVHENVFKQQNHWGAFLRAINFPAEELRAVISVAGSADSVQGTAGANFAQAILLPANGGNGGWKSVDIQYFPHSLNRRHQEFGPALRVAASESRWAPDSTDGHAYASRIAVITAFDVRLRGIVINRVSETDENSLSFAVDGGYIYRSLGGDIVAPSNSEVLIAALGPDPRTRYSGWAIGSYLKLRQVTGYADFQCLSCKLLGLGGSSKPNMPSLEGLQPIIGFRFEAPFFTVGP